MKIYRDLHWLIISPQALFRAWEIFKSDKRNKPDVAEFEVNLEQNVFGLYRDLKNGTYRHGGYKGFWIHDPKLRRIHKASVRDRVLHHAVFKVLNPIFEPTFIPTSFSCRVGKGTHKGMEKVAEMIRTVSRNNTRPCYALKCDVRKFFDSIDHSTLLRILDRKIKDEKVMDLMREIVDSFAASRPNLFDRRGVPIGNLTSQIFANIYMNEFDQFMKHEMKVEHYARYTDDFVIVSNDKEYLENLLPPMEDFLRSKLFSRTSPEEDHSAEASSWHRLPRVCHPAGAHQDANQDEAEDSSETARERAPLQERGHNRADAQVIASFLYGCPVARGCLYVRAGGAQ